MKTSRWMTLALLLATGCQGATLPTASHGSTARKIPIARASTSVPSNVLADPSRVVAQGVAVELIGKVKLISDKGLGIISNNGGGIVSNNGGGLISDKGLGYRLLDTAPPAESLLAFAKLEVLDGEGNLLVDAKKQPISTTTDDKGAYHFTATLPDENLVIRVKLFNGGQLQALLTKSDATGQRTLDIDTASTLGAAYVLTEYVKGSKEVYARLPESEAAKLQQVLEDARAKLTATPSYKPDDMVAATASLKSELPTVDQTLEHIKSLLLLGQSNLGSGLLATQVALSNPYSAFRDAAGNIYISETSGRIRKIDPSGHIATYVGFGATNGTSGKIGLLDEIVGKPDGTIYTAEFADGIVQRIAPDGSIGLVAGGGTSTSGSGKGTDQKLNRVGRLALGPDGSVYIAERGDAATVGGRLLKLAPDGTISQLPCFSDCGAIAYAAGIAVAADQTVYAIAKSGVLPSVTVNLMRLKPGATAWDTLTQLLVQDNETFLKLGPDGKLYLSYPSGDCVQRVDPNAGSPVVETVAGGGTDPLKDGQTALQGALPHPRGLWFDADGTMLVVCGGDGTLLQISPSGTVKRLAGASGLTQVGTALGLALNSPAGVSVDADGNLVFTENSSHTIKRLKGDSLELIAGSRSGYANGPVATARFSAPGSIALSGTDLIVVDDNNECLRKITAAGQVSTIVGMGHRGLVSQRKVPQEQAAFGKLGGLAIDAQGRPWFSDVTNSQILRLDADGQVEVVAGGLDGKAGDSGDGGPASAAQISSPGGMTFDKDGNLIFCDAGNFRLRKIDKDGNISAYAGIGKTQAIGRLLGGLVDHGDVKAADALFVGPASLCFDASGNLYIAELGSEGFKLAGAVTGTGGLPFTLPEMPARIRKLTPDGTVSILAGPDGKILTDPKAEDALVSPLNLAIDGQGRMAFVDTGANQIKVLPKGSF